MISCRRREHRHWPLSRKIHCAFAQLRRRADAIRRAVPGRRRGPHRPADWRQGPQPRGLRCLLFVARADAGVPHRKKTLPRDLFRHGAAPRVGLGARVLVAHDAAPPLPGANAFRGTLAAQSSIICAAPTPLRRRWRSNMSACHPKPDASFERVTREPRRSAVPDFAVASGVTLCQLCRPPRQLIGCRDRRVDRMRRHLRWRMFRTYPASRRAPETPQIILREYRQVSATGSQEFCSCLRK